MPQFGSLVASAIPILGTATVPEGFPWDVRARVEKTPGTPLIPADVTRILLAVYDPAQSATATIHEKDLTSSIATIVKDPPLLDGSSQNAAAYNITHQITQADVASVGGRSYVVVYEFKLTDATLRKLRIDVIVVDYPG